MVGKVNRKVLGCNLRRWTLPRPAALRPGATTRSRRRLGHLERAI